MRVIITGAGGQLGRALAHVLDNHHILPFGHGVLDVTDREAVLGSISGDRPDVVIHCAAWTDTAGCENDPERAMRENAEGARNVALACREAGAAMVFVSTNEVFDGEKGAPYTEEDATNPLNAYGRSKLAGEQAVRETLPQHYIVRTSWLYGPGRVSFPEKILAAAREKGALKLVADEIASPTWTRDLAAAIARLIGTQEYGVYHLVNEGECSRKEWAEEILRLAGVDVPTEAATQAEFGLPYVKPVRSALANVRAAALGVSLRRWREALADHLRETGELAAAGAQGARADA
jgi:dTDP-4-dehydrorhamnose reductase